MLKEMVPESLLQCIGKVHRGDQWLERRSVGRAMQKLLQREAATAELSRVLTAREIEVARLAARGARNREIADRLRISEGTVKVHLHNVYDKLKIRSRLELVLYAKERMLF